ncbi:type I HSP40 co-chaperone HLJ1 Ecym_5626 [Eremothecium cymbalariae DBVPG|uniref:J domain-containing protein n=1 Tax=Eremothecium cymbalariae (strain CBS 270.75 / DBVPG 7215 / KCTC 17166 / NRRL Y-17582) TaxID=931890 RepID=I6NE70_ERECY|nr:hypothetical protein Ecym_5626 [Eremothecium cymbalariae DBVPG\
MSEKEYTEEQEKITYVILNKDKHSFYELLQIDKEASDSDVKKAYRKLAIKLHPDKNRHPRAAEAFKKINRAFEVLSDENKRKVYDQIGCDPDDRAAAQESYRRGGGSGQEGGSGFEPFPSEGMFFRGPGNGPEDIFDFLFRAGGGGGPFGMGGGGPFDNFGNSPFGGTTTFTFGGPSGFRVYSSGPGGQFQQHGGGFNSRAQDRSRRNNQGDATQGELQDPLQHVLFILLIVLVFLMFPSLSY